VTPANTPETTPVLRESFKFSPEAKLTAVLAANVLIPVTKAAFVTPRPPKN
jgi:hypothetical protein